MGYSVTSPDCEKVRQKKLTCTQKTASREIFSYCVKTSQENRSQAPELHQGNRLTSIKIASGIPYWLGRDPIEEDGGINLYVFVGNEPLVKWDLLGLSDFDCVPEIINGPTGGPPSKTAPVSYGTLALGHFWGTTGRATLKFSNTAISGEASAKGWHGNWYASSSNNYSATASASGSISCIKDGDKCKAIANGGSDDDVDNYAVAIVEVTGTASGDTAEFKTTTVAAWTANPTTSGNIGVSHGGVSAGVTITLPPYKRRIKSTREVTYQCKCVAK